MKIYLYILLSVIVCVSLFLGDIKLHGIFHERHDKTLEIQQVVGDIRYLDEVLTMSARMASMTGDMVWEERYRTHEKKLDRVIKRALDIAPIGSSETDIANQKLIEMENMAFDLVEKGQLAEASGLLLSPKYKIYKSQYTKGLEQFFAAARDIEKKIYDEQERFIAKFNFISSVCVICIMVSTFISFRSMRHASEKEKIANQYEHMASLGRFAANIAHEVNNALQPVLGQSDILRNRLAKNEDAKDEAEKANLIYEAAIQIREIVENVLAHTQGVASQRELVSAKTLYEDMVTMVKQYIPETVGVVHDFSDLDEKIQLRLNQTDIRQTVKNIALNASYAMDKEGILTIEGRVEDVKKTEAKKENIEPGQYTILSITDTGHGMDKRTQGMIFEPLFTTKDEDDGSGLGLSISYGIMRSLGGLIKVKSKKGKGTTFDLYFPVDAQ